MGCLSDTLRGVHCPDPLTLRTTQYLKVEINSEKNVCVYIYIYIYIYKGKGKLHPRTGHEVGVGGVEV